MARVRRKRISFWANVPSTKRSRVSFSSGGGTVSFLTKKKRRKKISFYARR